MATRSLIGIQHADGAIEYIYCHWNGAPEDNGCVLVKYYTTTKRVKALIALGDLSELGREIGEKHDFEKHDTKYRGWCLAYHRDRGEPWKDVKPSRIRASGLREKALRQYVREAYNKGADYAYLWNERDEEWWVRPVFETGRGEWRRLKEVVQ